MPSYATPEGKFYQQSLQAKQRGIEWLLTFDQWWHLWQESGKWEQRGKRLGQYVMARNGDVGPYSVGNVYICTASQNHTDANLIRHSVKPPREKKTGRVPRGWTYIVGRKHPYQVIARGAYIGCFDTQEEAEAAYLSAVAKSDLLNSHALKHARPSLSTPINY